MKHPAFSFYPDNFLGGTLLMTNEQVGIYIRALCTQALNGPLTDEQLESASEGHAEVKAKFIKNEKNLWYNERLEFEKNRSEAFSKSQTERINKRWNKEYPGIKKTYPGITPVSKTYPGNTLSPVIPSVSLRKEKKEEERKETPFDLFWNLYPKKQGHEEARLAWARIPDQIQTLEKIKLTLAWQTESPDWTKEQGSFIPSPANYLSGKRWLDEKPKNFVDSKTRKLREAGIFF